MHLSKTFKIVIEKEEDGYVGYPLGLEGVVVGEGDTYEEALADIKSAIVFHIKTFGAKVIKKIDFPQEAFIAEAEVAIS
ncbi:MAG: type II toxin-antitoxin system HicB family antitoxin [Candidatus Omnitrophica bacterium]|nr:type II toxin-antitoxin system HicB family antitoxin [Candidatus Omnitrophota bacterium]MBU4457408.1 type II toxin-antitoxin system HicB family antitoxin [Candidatus Omnitrophota bacterium]